MPPQLPIGSSPLVSFSTLLNAPLISIGHCKGFPQFGSLLEMRGKDLEDDLSVRGLSSAR